MNSKKGSILFVGMPMIQFCGRNKKHEENSKLNLPHLAFLKLAVIQSIKVNFNKLKITFPTYN